MSKGKLTSFVVYVCIIISFGLFVPYDYWIGWTRKYYNYVKRNVWGFEVDTAAPAHIKALGLSEFKQMLSYSDAAAASAVKAMGDKEEYRAVPELIRLLNDTRPFRWGGQKEPTSIADLSKRALTQILRGRISLEPENIGLLIPYFAGITGGGPLQRVAIVEILGEIKEPLAIPLLSDLSGNSDKPLREATNKALTEINSFNVDNRLYSSLRWSQFSYVLGSWLMIGLLSCWAFSRLRRGENKSLILLSIVPIVLVGGMSWIIAEDFRDGNVDERAIRAAIEQGNITALRTMNYHDYTTYPGDSSVVRRLVSLGSDNVIHSIALLPTVQTVDDTTFTEIADRRARWIMARIIAFRLGTPAMDELIRHKDVQIRIAVARVLGRFMVRNVSIIHALTRLSEDEDETVRTIAAEALPRVKAYPIWPEFARQPGSER
jgi:hypothetical protein